MTSTTLKTNARPPFCRSYIRVEEINGQRVTPIYSGEGSIHTWKDMIGEAPGAEEYRITEFIMPEAYSQYFKIKTALAPLWNKYGTNVYKGNHEIEIRFDRTLEKLLPMVSRDLSQCLEYVEHSKKQNPTNRSKRLSLTQRLKILVTGKPTTD